MFRKKIKERGITFTYLAKKIGITREALYKKVANETEFKVSEISCASDVLQLTQTEVNQFFCNIRELNSTYMD